MATGVAPIEGAIDFNFREAVNALTHSSADAAMLASRWYDLCNTEAELDVTVSLSSGESMTVPNLGKTIAALKRRTGDIDASSVSVHSLNWGTDIIADGVDVGKAGEYFPKGESRSQHAYKTPFNEIYDCGYISGTATKDVHAFFEVPRFIFFSTDSITEANGSHTVSIMPIPANEPLLKARTDRYAPILSQQVTVINVDPVRTVTVSLTGDTTQSQVAQVVTLAPQEKASFLMWGQRGGDVVEIKRL